MKIKMTTKLDKVLEDISALKESLGKLTVEDLLAISINGGVNPMTTIEIALSNMQNLKELINKKGKE